MEWDMLYILFPIREKGVQRLCREQLARDKGRGERYDPFITILEKIAPKLIAKQRQIFKGVSPNIDFYSGFVYDMLNIPRELYTPLFCDSKNCWLSAHRLEELITTDKIIRPAYKSLVKQKEYIEREERYMGSRNQCRGVF